MLSLNQLNSAVNLPASLVIRDTEDQGRGIFTKKPIRRGKRIIACPPYSFGVGGITVDDVRALCHHCACKIYTGNPVVCNDCMVVGYCSSKCLVAALPLHKFECKGIAELEKLRAKPGRYLSSERDDHRRFWPPVEPLLVARAINKKILQSSEQGSCLSMYDLDASKVPLSTNVAYDFVKRYVRYLVPKNVSDDEIYQTFCRFTNNSATIKCHQDTSAQGIYLEYCLLNHMCRPNCGWEGENGNVSVFALQDIERNSQLGISYLGFRYGINLREIRRKELKKGWSFDCSCSLCLEEEKVGSRCWLLDQKKRSLIAPWSRQHANKVMDDGWDKLCQSFRLKNPQAIQLLEMSLEEQVGVLDTVNIILILTAIFLLYKCSLFHELCRRGMSHFQSIGEEGMNALFEYGTMTEIEYVTLDIHACCQELGYWKEADELSDLMQKLFPKVPSADVLHENRKQQGLNYDKGVIIQIQKDLAATLGSGEIVTPQQVSSCVAKLCYTISRGQ